MPKIYGLWQGLIKNCYVRFKTHLCGKKKQYVTILLQKKR